MDIGIAIKVYGKCLLVMKIKKMIEYMFGNSIKSGSKILQ